MFANTIVHINIYNGIMEWSQSNVLYSNLSKKKKRKVMSYIQTNNQREKGIFYWDKKNVKHVRCLVGSLSQEEKQVVGLIRAKRIKKKKKKKKNKVRIISEFAHNM